MTNLLAALGGTLGPLSTRTLLGMLESSRASGTLFVTRDEVSSLIVLQHGKSIAHTDLIGDAAPDESLSGESFDIDLAGARFGFWPHGETSLPTLPTRAQSSGLPSALWALPPLLEQSLLSTNETDLRALIARLEGGTFSGALTLSGSALEGLLLFGRGKLCGALCAERGAGEVRETSGNHALRILLHHAESAELTRYTLPSVLVASLMGLLLGARLLGARLGDASEIPEGFSGLELTPGSVRYYRAGLPYLQLRPTHPSSVIDNHATYGLFALCAQLPHLSVPTEPPGWEQQRYQLTLRGRDALNHMTELAMRFRSEFGLNGRRTLEQFRSDPSLEEAADTLSLDLAELKTTVERLESGSFIRRLA